MANYTILADNKITSKGVLYDVLADSSDGLAEFIAARPSASPGSKVTVLADTGEETIYIKQNDGDYVALTE